MMTCFCTAPGDGAARIARSEGNGLFTFPYVSGEDGAATHGIAGYDFLSESDRAIAFDYDGDGDDDLLLYRPGRGAASIVRANSDGTFTSVYRVGDNGAAAPNGIAGYDLLSAADRILAFDYDGDGDDDLFLYRPGDGAAWVARSNGNGTFTAVYTVGDNGVAAPNGIAGYDLLSVADKVLVFDHNGDGKDDLFLYRPGSGVAKVAQSNGDGTFTAVHTTANGIAGYDLLSTADKAVVFNYNDDGKDDLFLYRPGRGAASVVQSNGDGTFTAVRILGDNGAELPNGIAGYDLLSEADQVLAFDHDGDGKDELFLYRPGRGAASVARSNGDGSFTSDYFVADHPTNWAAAPNGIPGFGLGASVDQVLAFDHNGDGKDDLFLHRPGFDAARVVRSNGGGSFTPVFGPDVNGADEPNGLAGNNLRSEADTVLVFDYNGDGKDDLFLYRPGHGAVWVARANGNGTFYPVYAVWANGTAPPNGIAGYDFLSAADRALAFDYNGDGNDDLLFYRPGRGAVSVVRSNGDDTFTPIYVVGDNGDAAPNGIAGYDFLSTADTALAFDYDGDGDDDLLLSRPGRGAVSIVRSNGDGTFTPISVVGDNGIEASNGVIAGDFLSTADRTLAFDYDGDGDDDLFLYRPGSGSVSVVRSNGNGTFTLIHSVVDNGATAPNGIAGFNFLSRDDRAIAIDYNEDGFGDLVFFRGGQSLIHVARSNGDGTFTHVDLDLDDLPSTLQTQTKGFITSTQTQIDVLRDRYFPPHCNSDDSDNQHIQGNGTFGNPIYAHNQFSIASGWSTQRQYLRLLGDVNGDRLADIVGFGHLGVHVALSNGDGTFGNAVYAHNSFSVATGWMDQGQYPRLLTDVNGDGLIDIVGFADLGVRVAFSNGDGTFGDIIHAHDGFSGASGWASQWGANPRWVVDVNGDRFPDIVGFSDSGVRVAMGNGDGTFGNIISAHNNFSVANGWSDQGQYPRYLSDVNGDGLRDIVGFGHLGVRVALGNGDGTFGSIIHAHNDFSVTSGWVNQGQHGRVLIDVNRDGLGDILGFGPSGVRVALSNGDGTFGVATHAPNNSFVTGGIGDQGQYPRALGDVNGDGLADIVRFTDTGVYTALANHAPSDTGSVCPPLSGTGRNYTFDFGRNVGTRIVTDFGGLGTGGNILLPRPEILEEVDILRFQGEGLTAANLLLDQQGDDLHVNFEGIDDVKVILQTFDQTDLENHEYIINGERDRALGNIQFDGQTEVTNTIDVISANQHNVSTVLHPNVATFHTDGDNEIQGFDAKADFDGISNDIINAQDGNDVVRGLAGDDILRGGDGNDTLIGGFGNDQLTGGAGADIFRFDADSEGMDTIKDFDSGEGDRLHLSGSDLVAGVLNENQFSLGSGAVRGSDRLIYNKHNRPTFL